MFHSLKSQLIIALIIIMALFIGQEYVSNQSQSLLATGLISSQKVAEGVVQVKALEKDVLDLQRNVLIYKENRSPSALNRFTDIMISVNGKLDVTTLFIKNNQIDVEHESVLGSMRNHLKDYKENFESVVFLLENKNDLFNEKIVAQLTIFKDIIREMSKEFIDSTQQKKLSAIDYDRINDLTSEVQLAAYKYYLLKDSESITNFQDVISRLDHLLISLELTKLQLHLSTLSSDFMRLTQVTRNYNYLVNVVMSGSANEFLYLAKKLSDIVLLHLHSSNSHLNIVVEEAILRGYVMFVLGVFLTSIITIFILKRLIFPIQKVTKVFETLASNKELPEQLEVNRTDEIGQLMKSANIFQLKNKQTNELLIQSQELNEQLAVSQKNAEKATKSKSIFLANMSHEIRTPMNGIIGLTDLLSLKPLKDEEREYIDKIRYSSNILMSVINDILDFSKIEAGKIDIEYINFEPLLVLENVVEAINVKATEKNINVHCLIPANLPHQLIGDPVRLNQILLNLANNAVKFTHSGFISFNVKVEQLNDTDFTLIVDVIDTGIGISTTQQENIFDDFTQADDSTNRNFGGTGLGLSISKQLTQLMGGKISLTSAINEGSTFSIAIPFKANDKSAEINNLNDNNKLFIWDIGNYASIVNENFAAFYSVIENTQVNANYLSERNWEEEDFLVINVSGKFSSEQRTTIDTLLEKQVKLGFCCDLHALNARSEINSFGNKPIIHHPLLPSKLKRFTVELINSNKNSAAKINKSQLNTIIKEQNIPQFTGHVLIVEDNAINQIVASKVIKSFGLSYDIAEDGQQALTKVTNSPDYDLIFMDIQMPVMDGYEATSKIREAGLTELIICGLSANAMKSDIDKAEAAGMNEYITKPLARNEIQRILDKYLLAV